MTFAWQIPGFRQKKNHLLTGRRVWGRLGKLRYVRLHYPEVLFAVYGWRAAGVGEGGAFSGLFTLYSCKFTEYFACEESPIW